MLRGRTHDQGSHGITMNQTATSAPPFPGAVDQGHGSATFTIYAPGKQGVAVIGDFNDWDPSKDPLREISEGLWSLERDLGEGEHAYQFVVDDLTICDPYAREVRWPNGRFEAEATPKAVLRMNQPAFAWKHDRFERRAFRDLVIYELHVADFSAEGTFAAAIERLDYLRDLGVNCVQLLPVTECALNEGWGYQPTYQFAIRHHYGTADELRRLVDEAHARGIAVVFDVVLAHTDTTHPFNRLYPYEQSPWYGAGIGGTNEFGLPTFDHRKSPTQHYARDLQRFWASEFRIDGFRYDYAKNLGVDGENGLPRITRDAREVDDGLYLIGEWIPEDASQIEPAGLHAFWHMRSSAALACLALQRDFKFYKWNEFENVIRFLDREDQEYPSAASMVNYIESHDEHRLIQELRDAGANADAARRRLALAATVLMAAPGVPMIYQGQEYGEDTIIRVNERNPLRWDLLGTEGGKGLHAHYQRLLRLRDEHPALRSEGFKIEAMKPEEKWVVFHRWNDEGDDVVVAVNFADGDRTLDVLLTKPGTWRDVLSERTLELGEGDTAQLELQPSEAAIFVHAG